MPHHRAMRAELDDVIALIEREGEVIVQVVPEVIERPCPCCGHGEFVQSDHVDIYTRYRGIVMETR